MYSELDIHTEAVCDPLMESFSDDAIQEDDTDLEPQIEYFETMPHPTSLITVRSHDGRKFAILIITEEVG